MKKFKRLSKTSLNESIQSNDNIHLSLIIDDENTAYIDMSINDDIDLICSEICKKYKLNDKVSRKLKCNIERHLDRIKNYEVIEKKQQKEKEKLIVKRLYDDALYNKKKKDEFVEKIKKEELEKEMKESTFTPSINYNSNLKFKKNYKRIEDKLYYDIFSTREKSQLKRILKNVENYVEIKQFVDSSRSKKKKIKPSSIPRQSDSRLHENAKANEPKNAKSVVITNLNLLNLKNASHDNKINDKPNTQRTVTSNTDVIKIDSSRSNNHHDMTLERFEKDRIELKQDNKDHKSDKEKEYKEFRSENKSESTYNLLNLNSNIKDTKDFNLGSGSGNNIGGSNSIAFSQSMKVKNQTPTVNAKDNNDIANFYQDPKRFSFGLNNANVNSNSYTTLYRNHSHSKHKKLYSQNSYILNENNEGDKEGVNVNTMPKEEEKNGSNMNLPTMNNSNSTGYVNKMFNRKLSNNTVNNPNYTYSSSTMNKLFNTQVSLRRSKENEHINKDRVHTTNNTPTAKNYFMNTLPNNEPSPSTNQFNKNTYGYLDQDLEHENIKDNSLNVDQDINYVYTLQSIKAEKTNGKNSKIASKKRSKTNSIILSSKNINKDSKRIATIPTKSPNKDETHCHCKNIYERLYYTNDREKSKKEFINNITKKECPFKPKISERSRKMVSAKRETKDEMYARLSQSYKNSSRNKIKSDSRSRSFSIEFHSAKSFNNSSIAPQSQHLKNKNSTNTLILNTNSNITKSNSSRKKNSQSSRQTERSGRKIRELIQESELVNSIENEKNKHEKLKNVINSKISMNFGKFKLNNFKEIFEIIYNNCSHVNDFQNMEKFGIPKTIKDKIILPAFYIIKERNLEFNFQNFYLIANEIMDYII